MIRVHYSELQDCLRAGIDLDDITITGLDDVTLEQKCSIYNSIISLLKYRELQA